MVENIKLGAAALLVAIGIAAYHVLSGSSIVLRLAALFAGIIAGCALALFSGYGRTFIVFARESVNEGKKVVWPTRKETIQTTAAVFAFVIVMAVFLWISDKTLEWVLYDLVLGWKKT